MKANETVASNDVILLQDILERARRSTTDLLSDSEHQTYQVAKYYLHEFQPSHEDLMSGIVDGSRDGGLDGVYIFANGYPIRDDSIAPMLGKSPTIDLILLQVKNTTGFGEDAIDKLTLNLPALLDLERDEERLTREFSPKVVEVTRRFNRLYRDSALPALRIYICFAALKADSVHPNVQIRSENLNSAMKTLFRGSEINVDFLRAAEIFDLANRSPVITRKLTLAENPISTDVEGALVGLVKLREFERFITDEYGRLESSIFDANVRDYEGDTEVNRRIRATLSSNDHDVDFWWLNNGITILASRVSGTTKQLTLEGPQIVNGLQTSHEIYRRTRGQEERQAQGIDERSVLVKIVQASKQEIRDQIIEATNSQTALASSALRATDRVQRQIEMFLLKHDLYYERRKNLYANSGAPLARLVTIDEMGQALLATILQFPHIARGEVSRIYDPSVYEVLFSPANDVACYLGAIRILRESEQYLREVRATSIDDFKFHLAMLLAVALTRKEQPKAPDIAKADLSAAPSLLPEVFQMVQEEFADVARRQGETLFERLSKTPQLSTALQERARRYLRTARPSDSRRMGR